MIKQIITQVREQAWLVPVASCQEIMCDWCGCITRHEWHMEWDGMYCTVCTRGRVSKSRKDKFGHPEMEKPDLSPR